jgi:hypothetical protein
LGVATAEEKAKANHVNACSQESTALSAGSGFSGALSQLKEKEKEKAEDLKLHFNRPRQVGFRGGVGVLLLCMPSDQGCSPGQHLNGPWELAVRAWAFTAVRSASNETAQVSACNIFWLCGLCHCCRSICT